VTWEDLLAHRLAQPGAGHDKPWEGDVVVRVRPTVFAFQGAGSAGAVSPPGGWAPGRNRWPATTIGR
jgi:hypothetical protein